MNHSRFAPLSSFAVVFSVLLACMPPAHAGLPDDSAAADALPANISRRLRELVIWNQAQPPALTISERRTRLETRFPDHANQLQPDTTATHVVADVMLDGTVPAADMATSLSALGVDVFARHDATRGVGTTISVHLPLDRALEAAKIPGVYSINLVRPAHRRIGKATSQGVVALKVDAINSMYNGTGITVGVVSDSFDVATDSAGNPLADRAADDVASGDLPGPGNPFGHTSPVYVLAEGDSSDLTNTDEGRAMLQIVHDIAPGASLAFATCGETPETFAGNIRALRTDTGAHCDVIVDDIGFDEEPMFMDGVIAQAVDDVVHSAALTGRDVLYYSAAGNDDGEASYIGDYDNVSDADARAGTGIGNLQLGQVPDALTAGGFHNFNTAAGHYSLSQHVTVSGAKASINFQWDDPWIAGLVSTDFNLLVFDQDGNYLSNLSGTENNIRTGEALEVVDLPLGPNKTDLGYQLAISKRAAGLQLATHLRYVVSTNGTFETKKFTPFNAPTIIGHPAAPGADAVAAYNYTNLSEPETFTSGGSIVIYFDRYGNRYATPQVRQQPTLSGVDNVDTTFFPTGPGNDTDGDGFPNFSGTSAAAPHVAGVAALLLQAAGGPGSLTDTEARTVLESSAGPHDLDPGFCEALVTGNNGTYTATLTATGDDSNNSAFDKQFFMLTFSGPATSEVHKVVINLASADEEFDGSTATGFPFTVSTKGSTVAPENVTATLGDGEYPASLTLHFASGSLKSGGTLYFGIDRDLTSLHAGGNSADFLAGGAVKVQVLDGGVKTLFTGTFANAIGTGYSTIDGFGLINAQAAVADLSASGMIKTSGYIAPPPDAGQSPER